MSATKPIQEEEKILANEVISPNDPEHKHNIVITILFFPKTEEYQIKIEVEEKNINWGSNKFKEPYQIPKFCPPYETKEIAEIHKDIYDSEYDLKDLYNPMFDPREYSLLTWICEIIEDHYVDRQKKKEEESVPNKPTKEIKESTRIPRPLIRLPGNNILVSVFAREISAYLKKSEANIFYKPKEQCIVEISLCKTNYKGKDEEYKRKMQEAQLEKIEAETIVEHRKSMG